jgi:hypothetical protein
MVWGWVRGVKALLSLQQICFHVHTIVTGRVKIQRLLHLGQVWTSSVPKRGGALSLIVLSIHDINFLTVIDKWWNLKSTNFKSQFSHFQWWQFFLFNFFLSLIRHVVLETNKWFLLKIRMSPLIFCLKTFSWFWWIRHSIINKNHLFVSKTTCLIKDRKKLNRKNCHHWKWENWLLKLVDFKFHHLSITVKKLISWIDRTMRLKAPPRLGTLEVQTWPKCSNLWILTLPVTIVWTWKQICCKDNKALTPRTHPQTIWTW